MEMRILSSGSQSMQDNCEAWICSKNSEISILVEKDSIDAQLMSLKPEMMMTEDTRILQMMTSADPIQRNLQKSMLIR